MLHWKYGSEHNTFSPPRTCAHSQSPQDPATLEVNTARLLDHVTSPAHARTLIPPALPPPRPRPRAPPLSLVRVYADINTCVCLTMCTHFHLPSLSCLVVARSLHSPAAYYRNWPVDIVIQAYFGMQQPLGAVGEVAFKKQLYQSMLGQSKIPLSNRQSARGH